MRLLVLLGALALMASFSMAVTGLFLSPEPFFGLAEGRDQAFVERVVDGDTIKIDGGETVRLLGIDTPEKGQFLFDDAKRFLENLVLEKQVSLEKDATDRDKYNRLLRNVFVDGKHVNLELVKAGLASVFHYPPDKKYLQLLQDAEAIARGEEKGMWSFPEEAFCFTMLSFKYNAPGDDGLNLNSEMITFRNKCLHPIHLGGLMLEGESGALYTFPELQLESKASLTLHTGSGHDNQSDLFWGMKRPVWNNAGDTLFLRDHEGGLILKHTYP